MGHDTVTIGVRNTKENARRRRTRAEPRREGFRRLQQQWRLRHRRAVRDVRRVVCAAATSRVGLVVMMGRKRRLVVGRGGVVMEL